MWLKFGQIGVLFLQYWRWLLCFALGCSAGLTLGWKLWRVPLVLQQPTCSSVSAKPSMQHAAQSAKNSVVTKVRVKKHAPKPSLDAAPVPDVGVSDDPVEIEIVSEATNTTENTYDRYYPTTPQNVTTGLETPNRAQYALGATLDTTLKKTFHGEYRVYGPVWFTGGFSLDRKFEMDALHVGVRIEF